MNNPPTPDERYAAALEAARRARNTAMEALTAADISDRAAYIKTTDAIFSAYHKAIFAAIDERYPKKFPGLELVNLPACNPPAVS